ncbi:hypothetical protein IVB52_13135 [Bradyrhizobium sp. CW11]|nr:hypothetical protein [Bradyrhizobium sp. CW11]MCK1591045.1 hypothetical protein [Bradyrhizobium sp. 169]
MRKMGNYLSDTAAAEGANFITTDIARLVRQEIAYREDGALIDQARLRANMLSSHPAAFNFFGALKLNLDLATETLRQIAPGLVGEVTGAFFEHSPARWHPAFTNDGTAFDVLFKCLTPAGENAFIAIELKFSESMLEPPATMRPRYDELSRLSGLYKDPEHPALRLNPLQSLWREQMLAQAMLLNGLYSSGRFILVAPRYNRQVQDAVKLYRQHLCITPGAVEFDAISFDDLTSCIARAGADDIAQALHTRYCDFNALDSVI